MNFQKSFDSNYISEASFSFGIFKIFLSIVDDIFDYFSDPNRIKMKPKIISTSDQISSSQHSHPKKSRFKVILNFVSIQKSKMKMNILFIETDF